MFPSMAEAWMSCLIPMLLLCALAYQTLLRCTCSLPLAGAASMGAPAVVVRHDGFIKRDRCVKHAQHHRLLD
jgi:hypothetical protein